MRDEKAYVPVLQDADPSEGDDRAALDSCYSARQTDVDRLTGARGPTLGKSDAGVVRTRSHRVGINGLEPMPHFDQLACGWISNIRAILVQAVAPESATLPLSIVAVAIVTAFGLGWFCGSTSYSSRTADAKTLSRTASSSLPRVVTEKRAALITGSIAGPVSRSLSTSPANSRRTSLAPSQTIAPAQSTALAEQHAMTSQAPSAPQWDVKSGARLTTVPETRPATMDGWTVRDVYGGAAELVGPDRVWTVRPGDYVPGVGRINSITRWGTRWIVVTSGGLISKQ